MDIQYYGANCVAISTPNARVVVDDDLDALGLKTVTKPEDVALFSSRDKVNKGVQTKLLVDRPGEYEIADISIKGVLARAHMDESDVKTATVYKFSSKDIDVLVLGNIYPELSETELENIGNVDVLIVPVGGHGYTLDSTGALDLIKTLEPKIVVPVHYADKQINYPVPQAELDEALKGLAMEVSDTVKKMRIKPNSLSDATQLVVLERS